jgi:CubicO group peptidase (beta-lactamase class C family)
MNRTARSSSAHPPRALRPGRSAPAWIAALLALLGALPAYASDWAARHGLTGAQYQQAFDDYARQGYRLISISGYDSGGSARYAALWRKEGGPAWQARHGMTPQQYQAAFEDFGRQGYRLRYVNGYAIGGRPYYAAIWDRGGGPAWQARHGLTAEQYQAAVTELSAQGYGVSHVSAFNLGGPPCFAPRLERAGPEWVARHGLSAEQYQQAFNAFSRQGYRLRVVSGYRQGDADRYAAVWTKAGGPQWSARHGVPGAHYQTVFDNYRYQSWEPQSIEAFNSATGVRFNGLWHNTTFRAQDLALIERKVGAFMQANDIPGMSIAISRGGKLVFAAGYGMADRERGEPAGPLHRYRIASVSKPITHVAVARLIQDTTLQSGSRVFGANGVLGNRFATPANNPKIEDITVDHLIRHRGGWVNVDKDGNRRDPMFAYTGTGHVGLIEWTLANYPLGYDPGTANYDPDNDPDTNDMYSNFGYSLLGRIIEARSGKTYEAYVRDAILRPAGASGMVIGGDREADRKPMEVKYYGSGAYSSVKPQRFDSHGGWIASSIDLLRFMRHETTLSASYAHYGEMSGTMSVYRRRSDGFGYAASANSSNRSTEAMNVMLKEIVEGVPNWPAVDLF